MQTESAHSLTAVLWPMWHALSLQILVLQSPKNDLLFAIHLLHCHCLHAWGVCSGMLNVLFCNSLKTSSLGNYYAKCKNKGKNTDLPDLDSKLYCLELVPTSKVPARISGDRDFLNTDLHSSPLLPWYDFSMLTKTFVLILKIIHGLTASCIKFACMNPAGS